MKPQAPPPQRDAPDRNHWHHRRNVTLPIETTGTTASARTRPRETADTTDSAKHRNLTQKPPTKAPPVTTSPPTQPTKAPPVTTAAKTNHRGNRRHGTHSLITSGIAREHGALCPVAVVPSSGSRTPHHCVFHARFTLLDRPLAHATRHAPAPTTQTPRPLTHYAHPTPPPPRCTHPTHNPHPRPPRP